MFASKSKATTEAAAPSASSISLTSSALPLSQYHLLEIPAELLTLFTPSPASTLDADTSSKAPTKKRKLDRLTIKGRYEDQAVLTTDTQTFALRAVSQSNSLLLCSISTAAPSSNDGSSLPTPKASSTPVLSLRSNVTDTLELQPTVPRLDRLVGLLRPSRYQGEEEEEQEARTSSSARPRKYTFKQVKSIVQASPKELEEGLIKNYILELEGHMRLICPTHITTILQAIVTHIDLHAYLPEKVPLKECTIALNKTHGLRKEVTEAVLSRFFGTLVSGDTVSLDLGAIVKFLGIQQLKQLARIPYSLVSFMDRWRATCLSETLMPLVSLSLLTSEYILHPAPSPQVTMYAGDSTSAIQYYSVSELPQDPVQRFQDLFLTRPNWVAQDLLPFVTDLALDKKKLDGLLLKFCRSTKAKMLDPDLSDQDKLSWNKNKKVLDQNGKPKNVWKDVTMYSARVKY